MSLDAPLNKVYNEYRVQGTCHLHGDVDCGKINKTGTDGQVYPGRVQCTKCGQIFCRNGLWKKFGELVQGKDCAKWVCRLCLGTCCCRYANTCRVEVPDHIEHSHCHNFRSAYGQREKRKRKRLLASGAMIQETEKKTSQRPLQTIALPTEVHGKMAMESLPEALRALCRLYATTYSTDKSLAQILAEARYSHGRKWSTISSEAIADANQVFGDYRLLNLLQDLLTYKTSSSGQQQLLTPALNSPRTSYYPVSSAGYATTASGSYPFYPAYSSAATPPSVQQRHSFEGSTNGNSESYRPSATGSVQTYSDVVRNTNTHPHLPATPYPKLEVHGERATASTESQKSKIGIKDILSAGA